MINQEQTKPLDCYVPNGKNLNLSELAKNDPPMSENTLVIKLGYHTIGLENNKVEADFSG